MATRPVFLAITVALALDASAAGAGSVLIDDFEEGAFSLDQASTTATTTQSGLSTGSVAAGERTVEIHAGPSDPPYGSASLSLSAGDDSATLSRPASGGQMTVEFQYVFGAPFDLTGGGMNDRLDITLSAVSGSFPWDVGIEILADGLSWQTGTNMFEASLPGTVTVPLEEFELAGLDLAQVDEIVLRFFATSDLTSSSLAVSEFSALPEPGAGMLLALGLALARRGRRSADAGTGSRAGLLLISVAIGLYLSIAPDPARANAIYAYQGQSFVTIEDDAVPAGTYSTSMSVTGSFELAAPLGPNVLLFDVAANAISWTFSDGRNTLTDGSGLIAPTLEVATDSLGNIASWTVDLSLGVIAGPGDQVIQIESSGNFSLGGGTDRGTFIESISPPADFGQDRATVTNSLGTWTLLPEPSAGLLLALGLTGLASKARARRDTAPRAPSRTREGLDAANAAKRSDDLEVLGRD